MLLGYRYVPSRQLGHAVYQAYVRGVPKPISQVGCGSNGCFGSALCCSFSRTYHFISHFVVESDPRLSQLRRKGRANLLLQGPDQRIAECSEMWRLDAKACMALTRIDSH